MTSARSGWWDAGLALLPPSEEPTLTSTTASRTSPRLKSGHSARVVTTALQPVPVAYLAPAQLAAVQLRQAVDKARQPLRARMLASYHFG